MKKNKLPRPVSLLILTLLTTIVWISLSIYRAITTVATPSVPQSVSQPLTPVLNTDSINKIESAIFLDDSQIPQITTGPSEAPTVAATPEPSITPTPEATSSATL